MKVLVDFPIEVRHKCSRSANGRISRTGVVEKLQRGVDFEIVGDADTYPFGTVIYLRDVHFFPGDVLVCERRWAEPLINPESEGATQ